MCRLRLKCDGRGAKTRFRLSAKWTSPFKSAGASVQPTTGNRGVRISGSNAGYIMFQGSVKNTGYPLHSPVSPSLPLPCVAVCHHISTGLCFACLRSVSTTTGIQRAHNWSFFIHAEFRPHFHILTPLRPEHILKPWPNWIQGTSSYPDPNNSRPHPQFLTQIIPDHVFISWPNSVHTTSSLPNYSSGNSLTSSLSGSTSIISALFQLSL